MFFYLTKDGEHLIDSTQEIVDENYVPLTYVEYDIVRLAAKGYTRQQIKDALQKVNEILTLLWD